MLDLEKDELSQKHSILAELTPLVLLQLPANRHV